MPHFYMEILSNVYEKTLAIEANVVTISTLNLIFCTFKIVCPLNPEFNINLQLESSESFKLQLENRYFVQKFQNLHLRTMPNTEM